MGFAATLAIYAGLYVLSKILANNKGNRLNGKKTGEVAAPPEGTPIPVYWGRVRFSRPAVVWNSARTIAELRGFGATGEARDVQAWHVHALMILGIPQESYGAGGSCDVRFRRMYVNGVAQAAYDQNRNVALEFARDATTFETSDADVTSYFSYGFGSAYSDLLQSANGTLYIESGLASRGNNSLMGSNLFVLDSPLNRYDEWPSYRHQTKILLSDESPLWRGGNTRTFAGFGYVDAASDPAGELPSWEFEVASYATLDLGGGRPLIRPLVRGDANPAGVIFDILTAPWAKLGMDPAMLDLDSFAEAGETLFEENHGFSLILEDTTTAKELISSILAQIDGVFYEDPVTRLLVLSLTRNDYVVGSLPTFNEANVVEIVGWSTSAFDETYNEVRVIYTDAAKSYRESTAIAQDMANLSSQGGRVRALTRSYPGCTSETLASFLASRDLAEVSIPLISLRMRVSRDAWTLRPNECFKLSWAEYGIVDMVFRVSGIDLGTLEDSTIVIEAAQDRFAVTDSLMEPPKLMPLADAAPRAIERRLFTETPRWFLRKGIARGALSGLSLDQPRGYYLGAQPETASTVYEARVFTEDDPTLRVDMSQKLYPSASGVVETAYARHLEPYDTSVGLRVTFDRPILNTTIVGTEHSISRGFNLVYVGGEILAFETYTFISGTTYRLNNVWRGLLDTVPVAHAVGEAVFVLSNDTEFEGDFFTGNRTDFSDDSDPVSAIMRPMTRGAWMRSTDDAIEADYLPDPRGRTLLPYPSADVCIDGTKGTTRREEEGFELSWARRYMNYTTVTRGDDPSQITETVQYEIYEQRVNPMALVGDETLVAIAESDDEAITMTATAAGHGIIDLWPRSKDLVEGYENWQDPRLPVEFVHWRNLLANCRFSEALGWNAVAPWNFSGDATRRNTTYALGGAGWFVSGQGDGSSADVVMYQDVAITGWHPTNMRAMLQFYTRVADAADFDDLIQVDLIARDSSHSQVAIATYGPTTEDSFWVRRELAIANLPSTTSYIRVQVTLTADDEPPTDPNTAIAEMALWVGQSAAGGLTNGSFDSALSSWTTATGTFTYQTSVPYARDAGGAANGYARGGTGTTNEIYQEVGFPTGYEGGVAVLEYAQGDEGGADDDLGYAVIEARNGGTVLTSASLAPLKAVGTPTTWARRRLVLENLPLGTNIIRVRLIATRTAAGTADATFDSVVLRLHKQLDPNYKLDASITTPPAQKLPRSRSAWYDAYPALAVPDWMLYDGERLDGDTGLEPELTAPSTPYLGKLVGPYDPDHDTWVTSAYDFRPGGSSLDAVDDGAGHFGNFAAGEGFTLVAVVRPGNGNTTDRRICGRIDGTTGGWCLEYLSTGRFRARVRSGGTTWTASPTTVAVVGNLYIVQMSYDPAAGQLRCSVNGDAGVTASTTVGASLWSDESLLFRIGKAESTDTLWIGQVCRLYGWRTAYAHFVGTMFSYGGQPPSVGPAVTSSQTGQLLVPVGEDEDGAIAAVYQAGAIALGRYGGLWGYASAFTTTNICPSRDLLDAAAYPAIGGGTVTRLGVVGPTGQGDGVLVQAGVSGAGMLVGALPLTSAVNVTVYFYARKANPADAGSTVTVRLENTSNVVKGTSDVVLGNQWQRYRVAFTTWDDSTANGQIRFAHHASFPTSGVQIANVFVNQSTLNLSVLPFGASCDTGGLSWSLTSGSITEQFNREGEIYIEGRLDDAGVSVGPSVSGDIAIDLVNGTNNNDRRTLNTDNSSMTLSHYNASGTAATGTTGSISWASPDWTTRGRWQRAGLLDASSSFARVLANAASPNNARAATFTASTTPLTTMTLVGGLHGIITRLVLFAREVILGQDV